MQKFLHIEKAQDAPAPHPSPPPDDDDDIDDATDDEDACEGHGSDDHVQRFDVTRIDQISISKTNDKDQSQHKHTGRHSVCKEGASFEMT